MGDMTDDLPWDEFEEVDPDDDGSKAHDEYLQRMRNGKMTPADGDMLSRELSNQLADQLKGHTTMAQDNNRGYDSRNDRQAPPQSNRNAAPPQTGRQPQQDAGGDDEGGGYQMPAEQTVLAELIDHAFGESGTGSEQMAMQLKILEGPDAGKTITYYGYFTEKTMEHTFKSMRALGWQGADLTRCETMYPGKGGQKAMIVIEHEEDRDGNPRARVRWINKIGVAMKNKFEGGDLAKFAAKMKGAAMKHGGSEGGGSGGGDRRLPPPAQGQGRRDDVPPPSDDDEPQFTKRR